MAVGSTYTLSEVLAVATLHPFYSNAQYPPDEETINAARSRAVNLCTKASLRNWPLLRKESLYAAITGLIGDTSSLNTYRDNAYMSITGGGGMYSKPLYFCTDAFENRRQRASFGRFMEITGVIKRGDLVLSTHWGGEFYRSLDLTLEIMENAGASVLAAGKDMGLHRVIRSLQDFQVNVLTGDGSQVVQIAHYVSTLDPTERGKIKLAKIIYTSEALTELQKEYIHSVFGPSIKIYSVLGSAEAGPYGVSNPDLSSNTSSSSTDFLIDTRTMVTEVFPLSLISCETDGDVLPQGNTGLIVQTSLNRLRNPVVRYLTGDIGSIHPLPEQARAIVPDADLPFLQILRLQGRDPRFSFTWNGEYIEFANLKALMNEPEFGILQWQVILDQMEDSKEISLEVRLLCSSRGDAACEAALSARLRELLVVCSTVEHRFRITFVHDMTGFERSETGQKVIKFIDRSAQGICP
ncbi:hypothetical protein P154DRAFT_444171 [Amniculicola lignicola CBS 123094]|uniref:AMP-dependent synthetase/ligase domain-containing protein n=1 Tax=Amniculicola lignicola CBS 123094 TaxID=1392246 RepID=A0A6A5WAD6_9PLEO|nr:hypothetical protein P154DRAFT_444171 [Amniculicola lignicola CBS 123094]